MIEALNCLSQLSVEEINTPGTNKEPFCSHLLHVRRCSSSLFCSSFFCTALINKSAGLLLGGLAFFVCELLQNDFCYKFQELLVNV
jgi:hypothetical protein